MAALERLRLALPGGDAAAHSVLIGAGALRQAAGDLEAFAGGRSLFILSTPRVRALHGAAVDAVVSRAAAVHHLEAPDGEAAKSLEIAGRLWSEMLRLGGKRDSRLLALGGGSLCDLGGFVAACFLRGIEVAQVPSTLLAQVDASVGGKTAIDLPEGKNTVGAFHQPSLVIADTELLATLDRGELAAGLVEVIKMAALLDVELLARVERDLDRLLAADADALAPVVVGAVAAKIRIVEEDPFEADRRRLLNFGHTLGHALESALGYSGLRHGEAVAHGMRFALRLARRRGLEQGAADRLERVLARLGLPPLPPVEARPLLDAMRRDKKARESGLVWVLPSALGRGEMVTDVSWNEVETELRGFLAAAG
ncbi:MAG TPA: 3-dehydroquinate synthase [Thermoanaerobaculia bacterium]|nr:3-dehydroquinate synthase [Thermoanaerobaculia bacterium]